MASERSIELGNRIHFVGIGGMGMAPLAMILAENELSSGQVTIKSLRDDSGQQQISLGDLEDYLRSRVQA